MSPEAMIAEQVLMRLCVRFGPISETQIRLLSRMKNELLDGFEPADRELGYRWFNRVFKSRAAAVVSLPREELQTC